MRYIGMLPESATVYVDSINESCGFSRAAIRLAIETVSF